MAKEEYLPVNQEDLPEHTDESWEVNRREKSRKSSASLWLFILLLFSVLANGILLGFMYPGREHRQSGPAEYAIPIEVPTQYRHFWWNTEYSGGNESFQDEIWDSILPSHGIIAVDRIWAAEQNWPESMYLPGDKSKGVYLLEAYHQLHCLKILRKTMSESLAGAPFTYKPGEHVEHCFDYLLQTAKCNADSTPLYTFGDNTAGHGQLHKCRDWDALRDFATAHPACYRDSVEDIPLGAHFGYCDDGRDGLIEGSPQAVLVD